jgi:hypothetical protein
MGFSGNVASPSPVHKQITKTEVLASSRVHTVRTIVYSRLFSSTTYTSPLRPSFLLRNLYYDQSLNTLLTCILKEHLGFRHTERFIFFLPPSGKKSQSPSFIG